MNNEICKIHKDVYRRIKELMDNARDNVAREVNNIIIQTYREIGRIIVEYEQGNFDRAERRTVSNRIIKGAHKRIW